MGICRVLGSLLMVGVGVGRVILGGLVRFGVMIVADHEGHGYFGTLVARVRRVQPPLRQLDLYYGRNALLRRKHKQTF